MQKYDFTDLLAFLKESFGEDLRWVANFRADTTQYKFQFVRDDLTDDLRSRDLDNVIHRSLAVFNRRHVDRVYPHLGTSRYVLAEYERGLALHLYLDDARGVAVVLEPDAEVDLPGFVDDCFDRVDATEA
jgi:hypothetical protein